MIKTTRVTVCGLLVLSSLLALVTMAALCRCGKKRTHLDHTDGVCDYDPLPVVPKARKRVNARSVKMAAFYQQQRIPLVDLVNARDGWRCVIMSPWHDRLSDWNPLTVHEIRTRGREGGIMAAGVNEPDNCVSACKLCNDAMNENPEWAEAHGWLKPASVREFPAVQR